MYIAVRDRAEETFIELITVYYAASILLFYFGHAAN